MAETKVADRIDDALIEEIVRRTLFVSKPEKIILFGSAVAGGIAFPANKYGRMIYEAG